MADLGETETLAGRVAGGKTSLLGLSLGTTLLTVATLGLYSFWARTRIRRWLWSSMHLGGAPLDYTGRPAEKLMGFVVAACLVATYLGVVVMVLIFVSLTLFEAVGPGILASVALVLPVYWFARYRGQRYLANHTEWRGLGFSMAPGAWGYAARATGWTVLTLATAGLALPWRTHRLFRWRAERTFYGDRAFRLDGTAWPLARLWLPHWVGFVLVALFVLLAMASFGDNGPPIPPGSAIAGLLGAPLGALWLWARWRTLSFARLIGDLRWGGDLRLSAAPRLGRVVGIHLGGWILVAALLGAVLIFVGLGLGAFASGAAQSGWLEDLEAGRDLVSPYVIAGIGALLYLTLFLLRGAFRIALVTYPLLAHLGETLTVSGAPALAEARPGDPQHMRDADGFANLFDFGAGI